MSDEKNKRADERDPSEVLAEQISKPGTPPDRFWAWGRTFVRQPDGSYADVGPVPDTED